MWGEGCGVRGEGRGVERLRGMKRLIKDVIL